MTAEVVIMNKDAVALSADSTVTVTPDLLSGWERREKTYTSVNKVFMLSYDRPVGIMVYGNAKLEGVSWETLIKLYRDKRVNAHHNELKEYSEDFMRFLDEDVPDMLDWPSSEGHNELVLDFVRSDVFGVVQQHVDATNEETQGNSKGAIPENLEDFLKNFFKKFLAHLRKETSLFDPDSGVEKIKLPLRNHVAKKMMEEKEKIEGTFQVQLSDAITDQMLSVYEEILSRKFHEELSYVVIAGYGEAEVFPSLTHHKVWGYYKNALYSEKLDLHKVSREKPSVIFPCAQSNTIEAFLHGFDRVADDFAKSALARAGEILRNLLQKENLPKGKIEELLGVHNEELMENFNGAINKYTSDNERQVLATIAFMPKGELATLAEALVDLTSLKLRATGKLETVGGPTDVALISKGDGFVWVKNKSQIP